MKKLVVAVLVILLTPGSLNAEETVGAATNTELLGAKEARFVAGAEGSIEAIGPSILGLERSMESLIPDSANPSWADLRPGMTDFEATMGADGSCHSDGEAQTIPISFTAEEQAGYRELRSLASDGFIVVERAYDLSSGRNMPFHDCRKGRDDSYKRRLASGRTTSPPAARFPTAPFGRPARLL